jgi:hypothetical protein
VGQLVPLGRGAAYWGSNGTQNQKAQRKSWDQLSPARESTATGCCEISDAKGELERIRVAQATILALPYLYFSMFEYEDLRRRRPNHLSSPGQVTGVLNRAGSYRTDAPLSRLIPTEHGPEVALTSERTDACMPIGRNVRLRVRIAGECPRVLLEHFRDHPPKQT